MKIRLSASLAPKNCSASICPRAPSLSSSDTCPSNPTPYVSVSYLYNDNTNTM